VNPEVADMTGKTCLITGGSSGIGRATAEALARQGATIVLLARDEPQLEHVAAQLRAAGAVVDWVACDLASFESVRAAAKKITTDHPVIDVLINNAGVWLSDRRVTVDGHEMTFQVNYLSHFLLTQLLVEKATSPMRIVNVASTHRGVHIDFDDLMMERGYSAIASMGRTKLAMVLFTKTLARELAGRGITVNSLHPGVTKTNLTSGVSPLLRLVNMFGGSPEKGARTSVYLASSPEVDGVTGQFFIKRRPAKTVGQANDPSAESRLWSLSRKLCGLEHTTPQVSPTSVG
jgi:NAD(P)-dependent dehydrogenase (short-subunit alcohol dehydrogenase family)